jgi:hypothetical protein
MGNLEKRIDALEAKTAPADELTIIRRFVRPGNLDGEVNRLRDDDGNQWTRQTGESEQELIDRASLEVKRSPWGAASLTADDGEVCRADRRRACDQSLKYT